MDSKELNGRILKICDDPEKCGGFEAFGGKSIPYLGWFWRKVDFDSDRKQFAFGVHPTGQVGFMENNKWGYNSVWANKGEWQEIKALLIEAVLDPTKNRFKNVYDAIQKLDGDPDVLTSPGT